MANEAIDLARGKKVAFRVMRGQVIDYTIFVKNPDGTDYDFTGHTAQMFVYNSFSKTDIPEYTITVTLAAGSITFTHAAISIKKEDHVYQLWITDNLGYRQVWLNGPFLILNSEVNHFDDEDLTFSVGEQAGISFEEEGSALGTRGTVTELDFVGAGVVASRSGNKVTITVSGNANFRGVYVTLIALQAAIPTGNAGDYADVDAGVGTDIQRYIWDVDDTEWVLGGGSGDMILDAEQTSTGKKTFTPDEDNAGIGVGSYDGIPVALMFGDLWYNPINGLDWGHPDGGDLMTYKSFDGGFNFAPVEIITSGYNHLTQQWTVGGGGDTPNFGIDFGYLGNLIDDFNVKVADSVRLSAGDGVTHSMEVTLTQQNYFRVDGFRNSENYSFSHKAGTDSANSINGFTFSTGTSPTPNILRFSINVAGLITSHTKHQFTSTEALAGLNVGSFASDPSSPANWDIWGNTTSNQLKARINGATVVLPTQIITTFSINALASGSGVMTLTNMANTEMIFPNGANVHLFKFDGTHYASGRITCRVSAGSASVNDPRLFIQYSTDNGSNWITIGAGTSVSGDALSLTATNNQAFTNWVALPAGAKADVLFRVAQNGGDGAADPATCSVYLSFRT